MPPYPPVLTVPSRSSSDESRSPPAATTAAPPSPPRRRGKLPAQTTELLLKWLHAHEDHPYPTDEEKRQLCAMTGLTLTQVCNWMINARRRILAPNSHRHSGRDDAVIPPTWGSSSSPSPPFPSQRDYDLYAAATAMGASPGSSRHMPPTWEQLSDNSSSGRSASPSSNTSWTLHQHPYAPSVSPSHRHHQQQQHHHHHSPSPYAHSHSHTPHLPHTQHHDQLSAYAASAAAAVAAAAAQHHGGGHGGAAFDFHGLDSSHLLFTPDSITPLDPAYAQYFQQAGTQQPYAHWNSTN